MTKTGNGGVVSLKKVFDVRDLSVGTNKRGEGLRRVIDGKGIKRMIVEGLGGRHSMLVSSKERDQVLSFEDNELQRAVG